MKHVIIRVAVDEATLEALARRNGLKRATLKDFRNFCAGTLDADIEEMVSTYGEDA